MLYNMSRRVSTDFSTFGVLQIRFLAALSRGGAPQIEAAPKESTSTPSKKLTKAEKKALKAKDESAPVPVVVAATTTTTTTTTVSAAAAGLDAAVGQKRRASDAAAPAKEKKEKDAPAAKKVKGQDGKAVPAAAATTPTKEPKAKEVAKEKKSDVSTLGHISGLSYTELIHHRVPFLPRNHSRPPEASRLPRRQPAMGPARNAANVSRCDISSSSRMARSPIRTRQVLRCVSASLSSRLSIPVYAVGSVLTCAVCF